MRISRVVIRNFRSFEHLDVPLSAGTTCLIGENNTGKSNFLHAIRLCLDAGLSSTYRALLPTDIHSTAREAVLLYVTDNSNPRNRPSRFLREGGVCVC